MLFVLAAALVALVHADGDIKITNFPTGPINCGAPSFVLNWKYESSAVKYFTGKTGADLNVVVTMEREDTLTNTVLGPLATVTYPVNSTTINIPSTWPPEWTMNDKDVKNDGKSVKLTIEVQAASDEDITSYCGTFCDDPQFLGSCCPAGMENCACNANNCDAGLTCTANKCSKPGSTGAAGSSGGPCLPNNACTLATDTCDAASMTCKCKPGNADCICLTGNTCNTGNYCTPNGICKPGMGTATVMVGTPCTAGSRTTPLGTCSSNPLLACVNGACATCTTGTLDCSCMANTCPGAPGAMCSSGRCVPNVGCQNCPCDKGVCNSGLTCMTGVCMQSVVATTPAPTTPADPCASKLGTLNCPCAKNDQGVSGCTVMGLKCSNSVCINSATSLVVASLAVLLAVAAMF